MESGRQNEKLKGEMTVLEQRLQTAGADAVRDFQASQLFIDSCAGYYGTGFDDCLKQGWIFLGSPWTTEKMTPLNLLPLWRPTALWSWPSLLLTLQLRS